MNKIFKVIWNHSTQSWVATSELAKAKTCSGRSRLTVASELATKLSLVGLFFVSGAAFADSVQVGGGATLGTGATAGANTNAIVIGSNANAEATSGSVQGSLNGIVIGNDANATSIGNIALGTGAQARGEYSIVVGNGAKTESNNALVIGKDAKARNQGAMSIGLQAEADGERSIAIGNSKGSQATSGNTGQLLSTKTQGTDSIALGTNAQTVNGALKQTSNSKSDNSIAIGTSSRTENLNTIAFGTEAFARGNQGLAIGSFTSAKGNDSVSIGTSSISAGSQANAIGYGAIAGGTGAVVLGANSVVAPSEAKRDEVLGKDYETPVYDPNAIKDSAVVGNYNFITSNNTFVLGSNINSKQVTKVVNGKALRVYNPIGSTLDNSVYLGDKSTAVAGSAVGTKNQYIKGSGQFAALTDGTTTTAGDKGTVGEVKVGSISYGAGEGFAGKKANGVVTIGAAGSERRLQNLAAGEISSTSTDGINGSQLYAVTDALNNLAGSTATYLGGTTAVNPNGSLSVPVFNLYTGKSDPNQAGNHPTQLIGGKAYNNVGDALTALNTYINDGFKINNNDNVTKGIVTPGNVIKFANTGTVTATVDQETADGVTVIKFDAVSQGGAAPTTTDIAANTNTGKAGGGNDGTSTPNNTDLVTAEDVVNAINGTFWKAAQGAHVETNTESTGVAESKIKAGDTLTFKSGKNIALQKNGNEFIYATKDVVSFTNITVPTDNNNKIVIDNAGINAGNKSISNVLSGLTTYTDSLKNGLINLENPTNPNNAATVQDLQRMGWVVSSDKTTGTAAGQPTDTAFNQQVKNAGEVKFVGTGSAKVSGKLEGSTNVITVHVDPAQAPTTVNIGANADSGKVAGGDDGKGAAPTGNELVTAKDVVNAINGTFWKAAQGTHVESNTESTNTDESKIKAGDTLTFKSGKNIALQKNGNEFIYATKSDVDFKSVKIGDATNNVTLTSDALNSLKVGDGDKNGVISNLATTLVDNSAATSGTKPANVTDKKDNAATLGDVLNAGWNLKGNGSAVDFIEVYDSVDFINGQGTKVTVQKGTSGSTIKVDSPLAYINQNSNDSSTPSNSVKLVGKDNNAPVSLKNVASGLINEADPNKPYTLDTAPDTHNNNAVNVGDLKKFKADLSTTIGASSFTLTKAAEDGGEATEDASLSAEDKAIKANDTFTLKAGKNIAVRQIADGYAIATRDQVEFGRQTDKTTNTQGVNGAVTVKGAEGQTVKLDGETGKVSASDTDGSKAELDGKAGSLTLTADKKDPNSANPSLMIKPAEGQGVLEQSADNANAKETRLTYSVVDPKNPKANVNREVATMNDGLIFVGDAVNTDAAKNKVKRELGKELTIKGGQTDTTKLTENNIGVVADPANNSLTVKLAKNIDLGTTPAQGNKVNDGSISGLANHLTPVDHNNPASKAPVLPADIASKHNNAATVSDVLNVGWNLKANQNDVDFVKHNDSVEFINGHATVVSASANADKTQSTIKVDVDLPINFKFVNANGEEFVKANDGKFYAADQVKPDGSFVDPNAKPTELTDAEVAALTKQAQLTNGINSHGVANKPYRNILEYDYQNGKPVLKNYDNKNPRAKDVIAPGVDGVALNNLAWATNPDQAVNLDQLTQTVYKSGFYVQNEGKSTLAANAASSALDKTEKVTPGDVMNFNSGVNTKVIAQTQRDTVSGVDTTDINVNVVGLPVSYSMKEGDKNVPVAKVGDKFYKIDPATGLPKVDAMGKLDPTAEVTDPSTLTASMVNPSAADSTNSPIQLGNLAQGAKTFSAPQVEGKEIKLANNGNWYNAEDVDSNGVPKAGKDPIAADKVQTALANANAANGGLIDFANSNPNNAATVGDLQNLGFQIGAEKAEGSDKAYHDQIRNNNKLNFVGDNNNISVTGSTKADGTREIKVELKQGDVVKSNEFRIMVNGQPTDVIKIGDKYYAKDNVDPTTGKPKDPAAELTPDQNTQIVNNGAGLVTGNKVADAIQQSGWTIAKASADEIAKTSFKDTALAADIEKINPEDNVRFADGKGTIVKLGTVVAVDSTGSKVTTTAVKFDVDLPIDFKYTDATGKEYVKAIDGKFYPADKLNPDGSLKADTTADMAFTGDVKTLKKEAQLSNGINQDGVANQPYALVDPIEKALNDFIKANPTATADQIAKEREKAVAANPDAKDKLTAGTGGVNLNNVAWATKGDQAVNKDQLDQSVNKAGFFVKQNGTSTLAENKGSTDDNKTEKVTPNDVVNFVDGGNTRATAVTKRDVLTGQDNTSVSYHVTGLPISYTDADGNLVAKVGDEFYKVDPTTGLPKLAADGELDPAAKVAKGDLVTNLVNPNAETGKAGEASQLGNVAAGAKTFDAKEVDGEKIALANNGKWYKASELDAQGNAKANAKPITKPDSVGNNGLVDFAKSNPTNAATVKDLQNLGFVIGTSENSYDDQVRNNNKLNFVGDEKYISVKGSTKEEGTREIKVALKEGEVVKSNEGTATVGGKEITVIEKDGKYYAKQDIDLTTGNVIAGKTPVILDPNTSVINKGDGLVTGNKVADAIQKSGWNVGKAKAEDAAKVNYNNQVEKINPDDNVHFADGKNSKVSLGTEKKLDENGAIVTTTTIKVDVDSPIDFKYTDAQGNEYKKANNGLFYKAGDLNADGSLKQPTVGDITPAPQPLSAEQVAKLNKGAQLTNGINADGINNQAYSVADPIQNAVQTAVANLLKDQPNATADQIAATVTKAKAEAIKAEPSAKDKIVNGTGGVSLDNVAWATKGDQAVNKDQLDQSVNKAGFFVKQNGTSTLAENKGSTDDNKTEKVTPNDVVNFVDGGNTRATAVTKRDVLTGQDNTSVSYHVTGLPISYTDADGNVVAKVGDEFYKVDPTTGLPKLAADGELDPAAKVEKGDLVTNLVNPNAETGKAGEASQLGNVAAGTETLSAGDNVVKVGDKFYNKADVVDGQIKPDAKALVEVNNNYYNPDDVSVDGDKVTVNAGANPVIKAADAAQHGLADLPNSKANNALSVADAKKLGFVVETSENSYADDMRNANRVDFVGDSKNMKVEGKTRTDGTREVKVSISDNPVFNSVQLGGNNGPTISSTTEGDLKLSKEKGEPVRITNVAPGKNGTDAVNVNQLNAVKNDINSMDKNLRAGIAGSNAAAGLPQVYIPGKSMVAASVGTYKGQSALAFGYSRSSDNGKVILKLQGNTNTRGDVGGSVGVGYQW